MAHFGPNSYIQLPPDNVGKRSFAHKHVHVDYNSGTIALPIGTTVVDSVTGALGLIVATDPANTVPSGSLVIVYDAYSEEDFAAGGTLNVSGTPHATIASVEVYYSTGSTIIGANNPHNAQFVDSKGASYVRFSEGEQQLDAFGLSRQTSPTQIGDYFFGYDDVAQEFSDEITGTASCVHIPNESSIRLSAGTGASDSIRRTTNRYHIYQPGFGQMVNMTIASGDSGKANVVRTWGVFDANDGLFFELNGTTLNLVLRSSVTGSVVETRWAEAAWNGDKVNGEGGAFNLSHFNLDVTQLNIYWIDYQWLGAGRVRFGVVDQQGNRVIMHTVENANTLPYPYMKSGTLPLRFEVYNTATPGSTSELKVTCCSVVTDGNLVPDRKKRTIKRSAELPKTGIGDTETFGFAVRAKTLINGITNRKIGIPEFMSLYVKNNPVVMRVYKYGTVTDGTWNSVSADSAIEVNADATVYSLATARHMLTWHYDVGSVHEHLPDNFGYQGENIRLNADGSQDLFIITFECLTASQTADVDFAFSWIDMG